MTKRQNISYQELRKLLETPTFSDVSVASDMSSEADEKRAGKDQNQSVKLTWSDINHEKGTATALVTDKDMERYVGNHQNRVVTYKSLTSPS